MITLDADVFVRFGHFALIQDLHIDDVRVVRGADLSGPKALAHTPTNVAAGAGPVNQIEITFDEAIDASSFTPAEASLWNPLGGVIAVATVSPVGGSGNTRFAIGFADQTIRGVYRFRVAPTVKDTAGNALNQDGDFLSGESNDGYSGSLSFASTPQALAPAGMVLYSETFETWPPPGDSWSFDSISPGTLGVATNQPHGGSLEFRFDSRSLAMPQWAALQLDLSSVAAATDLAVSFWARQDGSSHGRVCLEVSGDGATWHEATRVTPSAAYGHFGVDLDAVLGRARIALDADVYIRLRHFGLIQDLFIDDFQILQGVDVFGPTITALAPAPLGAGAGPLNQIVVNFDEPIDPTTLDASDFRLIDPWGAAVAITGVSEMAGSGSMTFTVDFADQNLRGSYRLTAGPGIADTAGNLMNQDGDIQAGESEDAFVGNVAFESTFFPLTGDPGSALLSEGFETWPQPGSHWSFGSTSGGLIAVSQSMPRAGSNELQFSPMSAANPQWMIANLDFTAVAAATDLGLEFWARHTGSVHGRMCIDLSGDGTTWTEAMLVDLTTGWRRYSMDLDGALALAGIALDANVRLRIRHLGLTQSLYLDDVRIVRGLDVTGPSIASHTPTMLAANGGPLNSVNVTFSEAIDSESFGVDDVKIWDPYGAAVEAAMVSANSTTVFTISFADQTIRGNYRITVGPNISDAAGNLMNQDGDLGAGESEDVYLAVVQFASEALALTGAMGELTSEGFESWPPAGSHWSFSANAGGVISISTNTPRSGDLHLLLNPGTLAEPQHATLKLDLTGVSAATDLSVDFWAMRTGSTIGRFCVDVSGDGATWKEVFCARSTATFQNYAFDLDQALQANQIALDVDVWLRFRHSSLIQDFALDDVRIMRVGDTPASITLIQPVPTGVELTISGSAGVRYRVESSTDLTMWSTIGMVTGAENPVKFVDTTMSSSLRYYRVVLDQMN